MKEDKMKGLVFLMLLFGVQACIAKATPPVFHSHNGRIHQHSLPTQGIGHRHGNGALGVIAKSTNNAPTISSSVIYDATTKSPQPTISSTTTTLENTSLALNYVKGDTRCQRGAVDCNVCANNVQQQFSRASRGQLKWRKQSWGFTWAKKYPPYGIQPLDVFDGKPAYPLGIPDKHIQGFARTNSDRFPFVGTHSHKRKGGVFVVSQNGPRKNLFSLQKSKGGHPSGLQVIGNYLVYGDGGKLIFKDINSHNQAHTTEINITPKARFGYGGGLGILKLSKDNLLVLTSGPGSQDSRPRYNYFYHLKMNNNIPQRLTLINKSKSVMPAQWPKILGFSENLSLITECGTGDIYSVHTTGDSKGFGAIKGNGYWRLSKLIKTRGQLKLKPLAAFPTRQNMANCNLSSAATVHTNQRHQLEFYCHGYAKDPSGSTFNVLGSSSHNGQDKFDFKVGTLN
jgi:hypothetical protein